MFGHIPRKINMHPGHTAIPLKYVMTKTCPILVVAQRDWLPFYTFCSMGKLPEIVHFRTYTSFLKCSASSGVARAFPGGRPVHLEPQIEEENEEKLMKDERKSTMRGMRKN